MEKANEISEFKNMLSDFNQYYDYDNDFMCYLSTHTRCGLLMVGIMKMKIIKKFVGCGQRFFCWYNICFLYLQL